MEFRDIYHFSHEHYLWVIFNGTPGYRCSLCSRPIEENEMCYTCSERCLFRICTTCARLPQHINHLLHPVHPLTLAKRSFGKSTSNCCHYCEKLFEIDACTYGCDQCSLQMHTECALIPLPTIRPCRVDGDDGEDGIVQYDCHERAMALVEHDGDGKEGGRCFACRSLWSGAAYSCTLRTCDNFLHKSCAELPMRIRHPFHSHLVPLTLEVSKPRSCCLCCKKDCRLIFSCHEEGCNFILGTECAFLEIITMKCRSHDHLVCLVERTSCEIRCDACKKCYKRSAELIPEEINQSQSIFRCKECDFNLHFLCGPLPSIIKYEYHIHPLTLIDHEVTDDYLNKYYCDVCEEERNPQFRVYYCESCNYTAHVHCLMAEIMKVIKMDAKEVVFEALGESRWKFDNEKDLQQNENARVRGTNKYLTMRDVMDGLTIQEKNLLIEPSMKAYKMAVSYHYRLLNSRFDSKGSIQRTDRLLQFFHFDSDDFNNFFEEISCFKAEELKLEEKYLRQKVEDVEDFMVPETLAPILKTLLHEYGSLGDNCKSLTPGMKSVAATLLCVVIESMCQTSIEDVTKEDLKYWYYYLDGIKNIGFREIISLASFKELIMNAFLGYETCRCEEDVNKNLDLRIAELELELKICKENRDKLKIGKSEMSNFLKECVTRASKFKGKKVIDLCF